MREKDLPESNKRDQGLLRKFKEICGAIVDWHELDLQTGEIGENPVERRQEGWDRKGSLKRKGDS